MFKHRLIDQGLPLILDITKCNKMNIGCFYACSGGNRIFIIRGASGGGGMCLFFGGGGGVGGRHGWNIDKQKKRGGPHLSPAIRIVWQATKNRGGKAHPTPACACLATAECVGVLIICPIQLVLEWALHLVIYIHVVCHTHYSMQGDQCTWT